MNFKPCPLCGGIADFDQDYPENTPSFIVCQNELCVMKNLPMMPVAWNRPRFYESTLAEMVLENQRLREMLKAAKTALDDPNFDRACTNLEPS